MDGHSSEPSRRRHDAKERAITVTLESLAAGAPSLALDSDALVANHERLSATRRFESG